MPTWLDVFPVKQDCAGMSPERAVFVDVGGGLGHQCMSLRNHFPDLTGRVVLQDIPATLEHVTSLEKVEIVAQDFFQPQAVKGRFLDPAEVVEPGGWGLWLILGQEQSCTISGTSSMTIPTRSVESSSRIQSKLWPKTH